MRGPFRPIKRAPPIEQIACPRKRFLAKKCKNFSGCEIGRVTDGQRLFWAEAPGRVEILGNHTDYNEGVVLGAAIDRVVRMRGTAQAHGGISLRSTSYPAIEIAVPDLRPQRGDLAWGNYALGVASELRACGVPIRGFSAEIQSDVPADAGLGSSAAIGVATAFLLLKLAGRELPPLETAKVCQRAERRFADVQSGLLDQVMSVFGKAGQVIFFDCRTEQVRTIPLPAELAFVIADSGIKRELAAGKYNERRAESHAAAQALGVRALRDVSIAQLNEHVDLAATLRRRAAHVIGENERVWRACELLERGDAAGWGELMNESHESSRTNFQNSAPELDELVDLARKQPGVLGARLTGGGFGGAIIALCEQATAAEAAHNLAHRAAQAFVCRPADGALTRN
jgi:galactokinase